MMRPNRRWVWAMSLVLCWSVACGAVAQNPATPSSSRSIADRSLEWPSADQWRRVLLLEDYNTRVVILGTLLLGGAAGMVGSFTLLRKRALMGDALSHATLPGICIAFILAAAAGIDGKSLPLLLLGATASGLAGVGAILAIRALTRLKEDTALGAVLSVFFGAGIALLGIVQQMRQGHAAGLEAFIYGKTASMSQRDAMLIAAAAVVCISVCLVLLKELKLLCFDQAFAGASGYPVLLLDLALMSLVVIVTIVGLQAVGLILMIALLVIPAAAARFWSERLWKMALISAALGAAGGMVGASISALFADLPSGAMIVLVCTLFFLASMVFGSARGVLPRGIRRLQLNRTVHRQHLLRAMYELAEVAHDRAVGQAVARSPVPISDLLAKRSWSRRRLEREIRRAQRARSVERSGDRVWLTEQGLQEARRLTRQHRLWELYLIRYADIAPGRVDQDADAIEHVLAPEVVAELESLLKKERAVVPASPHELAVQSK